MIETTQSIFADDGTVALPRLVAEGRGRIVAAHFGTYDYTAACSITAAHQHMLHPACDFAKHVMQVALAGTGIHLSDGATNIMPIGSRDVVHRAWRLHAEHVRHSLVTGFYQGWDLHPAQLPTRYAAVFAFFLEGLDAASDRLKNFVQKAAQATLVGDVFDDAATGQGLLNYFLRAMNCGAITEAEAVERSGLSVEELRTKSFAKILSEPAAPRLTRSLRLRSRRGSPSRQAGGSATERRRDRGEDRRSRERSSSRGRRAHSRKRASPSVQLADDVRADRVIEHRRRAHLHRAAPEQEVIQRVLESRNAADAREAPVGKRLRELRHLRERQRQDRRTAESARGDEAVDVHLELERLGVDERQRRERVRRRRSRRRRRGTRRALRRRCRWSTA